MTAPAYHTLHLAWTDNSANETGFIVEVSTNNGATFASLIELGVNVTTYDHAGLAAQTTRMYRIRAKNAVGNSGASNAASGTTPAIQELPGPLNLSAFADETLGTKVRLSWSGQGSSQGMLVQRSLDGLAWTQVVANTGSVLETSVTGLSAGTINYFRVRPAANANAAFAYADVVTKPSGAVPNPPGNLVVTTLSTTSLRLAWTDNASNETNFVIEISSDGKVFTYYFDQTAANDTTEDDAGLATNTTFYYRIRAKNANGVSAPSNVASGVTAFANTAPLAPTQLTGQAASSSRTSLQWVNSSPADGIEVQAKLSTAADTAYVKIADMQGTAVSVQIEDNTIAGLTLNWRLRAFRLANPANPASTRTYAANYSNVIAVTMPATTAATGIEFINNTGYPIVFLTVGATQYFPQSPNGVPNGGRSIVPTAAGNGFSYQAQNGFWQNNARATLYTYNGTVNVTNGQRTSVTLSPPTGAQLMMNFQTGKQYAVWSGWFTSYTGFTPVYLYFYPNNTCRLFINYSGGPQQFASGTYALNTANYGGSFIATINLTMTGTYRNANGASVAFTNNLSSAKLQEGAGYFLVTLPISANAIQFNFDQVH